MFSSMNGITQNPNNPAAAAMPFLSRIPVEMQPYFSPYMSGGMDAYKDLTKNSNQMTDQYDSLTGAYDKMTGAMNPYMSSMEEMNRDPSAIMKRLGAGYTESPGYKFRLGQGMNAANQSAAAGGMAGTPMAQQNASQISQNLASEDYGNYLNNALSLFNKGTEGLGSLGIAGLSGKSGLYNSGLGIREALARMGYNANSEMGNNIGSNLASQGNLAYAGAQSDINRDEAQRNRDEQERASWLNLIGGLGGAAMGAGAAYAKGGA